MGKPTTTQTLRWAMGLATASVALGVMSVKSHQLPILLASLFLLVICLTDTLSSRIPNLLTYGLAICGLLYNLEAAGARGAATSLLGFAAGLGLLLVPFLLGGMGAGDVKALGALGALLGPGPVMQVFLYMAFIGGLLSLCFYAFSGRLRERITVLWQALYVFSASRERAALHPIVLKKGLRFPYAVAIALGYFAFLNWGRII